jgi:hypothetical protein
MRKAALAATTLVLTLAASAAFAQMPAQNGPQNPAVHTDATNNSNAPVKGANSFTMSEAKSRIAGQGYTHVASLKKDVNGVWRGTATKDGQRVHVSLDYQGNVNTD